jgi:hypothetical protein
MAKPISKPDWTASNSIEPSPEKKAAGWGIGEKPYSTHFNWLFKNVSEWVDYLDTDVGDMIAEEYSRALAAETTLSQNVSDLSQSVVEETSRALVAEQSLSARIDSGGGGGSVIESGFVLPTVDSSYRGKFFLVKGSPGVPDTLYFCAKDYLDAYKWFEVVLMNV